MGRRRSASIGLKSEELFNVGYLAVISGVVGAHLLHVALNWNLYSSPSLGSGLWNALAFWRGGLVYYGGLAAGMLALALYTRFKKISTIDLLDLVAPLGALGLAATRGGCFLNGCCYGRPSELPWAVSFPPGSRPQTAQVGAGLVAVDAASLPIHPTQLYELVAAMTMFALLWAAFPARRFRGQIVLLFFLLYAPWRFFSEFLRADSEPWRPYGVDLGGLNVFQGLSAALFVTAAALWVWASRRRPVLEIGLGIKSR